jgi:hypothetical protein
VPHGRDPRIHAETGLLRNALRHGWRAKKYHSLTVHYDASSER